MTPAGPMLESVVASDRTVGVKIVLSSLLMRNHEQSNANPRFRGEMASKRSLLLLFNRWESVKCFIRGMGRLNLLYIIKLYRIRFMFHLLHLNHGILYNLFYVYFADRYKVDDCLAYIFRNLADATRTVYEQFALVAQ